MTLTLDTTRLRSHAAAAAVPEDLAKQLAKLAELRRPGAPFPLRLTRFFWRDGEAGFRAFLALTEQYTSHGFPVELQVRYQPSAQQEGDIDELVRGYAATAAAPRRACAPPSPACARPFPPPRRMGT